MATASDLLMEIQRAAGYLVLSDLHAKHWSFSSQTKALLMKIPLGRYSLSDWNRAVSYITGENCCYESAEEARCRIAIG